MTKNSFTQFGTFTVAILVPLFILCLAMLFVPGIRDSGGVIIMGSAALIMFICLLIFYKITISVDESSLTFSLGVGLIKKKYPFDEIKSCRPVKNSPLTGFGIRMISNGWLFNVSGLGAIELAFKNKKSIVRIGTDNPELVSKTINEFISQDIHGDETFENKKAGKYYSMAIFVVVVAAVALLLIAGNRETSVKSSENEFTLNGIYGITVRYEDILFVDTLSNLPGIKLRTNGFAFGKTLKGHFKLDDGSQVKLFITKGTPPYIHFRAGTGEYYLNFRDNIKTRKFYGQLKTEMSGNKL